MRYRELSFDRLRMYFGEPYVIDCEGTLGSVTVHAPTIGELLTVGEDRFFATLSVFINNTTSMRLPLWNAGIDWNVMTDFELFVTLYRSVDAEVCRLLFGELDFQKFVLKQKIEAEGKVSVVLVNEEAAVEINEEVYQYLHQYLQAAFNMYPEEKITQSALLKQAYLSNDRAAAKAENKERRYSMQSVISACVNHPGFKYKLSELREVGVCEFYDSVKRLQVYEAATALMKGMYSGMVDGSKIDPESYNFMKDINQGA